MTSLVDRCAPEMSSFTLGSTLRPASRPRKLDDVLGGTLAAHNLLQPAAPDVEGAALFGEPVIAVIARGDIRLDVIEDHLYIAARYPQFAHACRYGAPQIMRREPLHLARQRRRCRRFAQGPLSCSRCPRIE